MVEAVRNRLDGSLGAVYDAYAPALYQYCWYLLADEDAAGAVVRDVFIVMEGRIDDLADPAALRSWLFAIARCECRRRMANGPGSLSDLPPRADEDAAAAVPRAIALAALAELDDADADLLVLRNRFRLSPDEIARVAGLPPEGVPEMLTRGGEHLRDALTAEILTRKGPSDCPRRSEILAGWGGQMTPELRDGLVRHASVCEQCEPGRPRTVAPAKVFDPLPWPELPGTLRVRVMSSVSDPSLRGYRNFVLYRAGIFGRDGFPRSGRARPERRRRVGVKACAGIVALLIAVTGVLVTVHSLGGARRAVGTISTWANDLAPRWRPSPAPQSSDDPGGRMPVSYPGRMPDQLSGPHGSPVPQNARDVGDGRNGPEVNRMPHRGVRHPSDPRPAPSRGNEPPRHGTAPRPADPPPSSEQPPPSSPSDPPSDPTPSDPPSSPSPSPSATPSDPPSSGSPSPSP